MPAKGGKGTTWTPELERRMLILLITAVDAKPSTATWNLVAQALGNGLTASAVSQKFGKLKKASESETGVTAISIAPAATTPPVTPQSKKRNTGGTGERKRKAVATLDNTGHMKRKKPNGVKSEPTDDEQSEPDEQGPNHNAVDGEAQNGDPITESHPIANGTDEEDAENGASVTGDGVTLEVDADGTNGIKVEDEADDELED